MARTEAYLHAKFHLDPSNRLATVHQRYRQTGQRSDTIGRTVLQTVAQKLLVKLRDSKLIKLNCIRGYKYYPYHHDTASVGIACYLVRDS